MATSEPLQSISCLIVSSTGAMRALLTEAIRKIGVADIRHSGSFDDAICKVRILAFDLIIWAAPFDGQMALLRFVRRDLRGSSRATPFISVSDKIDVERLIQLRDTGVTGFMTMPVSLPNIRKKISFALNDPREFIDTMDYVGPTRRLPGSAPTLGPLRRIDEIQFFPVFRGPTGVFA